MPRSTTTIEPKSRTMLKLTILSSFVFLALILLIILTQTFILLIALATSSALSAYLLISLRNIQQRRKKTKKDTGTTTGNSSINANSIIEKEKLQIHLPFLLFYGLMVIPIAAGSFSTFKESSVDSIYSTIIAFGMTMTFVYNFLNVPLAIYHKKLEDKFKMPFVPPLVTIIVPAYNEEYSIQKTLASIVESDYPNKEIIVVDDGSTDSTYSIAYAFSKRVIADAVKTRLSITQPIVSDIAQTKNNDNAIDENNGNNLTDAKGSGDTKNNGVILFTVLRKPNGGKSSAINYALRFAKGEIAAVIDADSLVGREGIKEIIKYFQDPDVVAVGGNIKVINRVNLLTYCQALEYLIGINLFKRAFDIFGVVMVVPGALGAFRKKTLMERGSYDNDTLTEDFDATIKALKTGKAVQASTYGVSFTEAPVTLKGLYRQRIRWNRGNMQTLIKHRDVITTSRYGMLQKYGYPLVLLTMVTQTFLGLIVAAFIILALVQGMWYFIAVSFLIFTGLEFLLSAITIIMDQEDWKLALVSPLFVIGYKQLTDFIIAKSILDVILFQKLFPNKHLMTWTSAKAEERHRKLR